MGHRLQRRGSFACKGVVQAIACKGVGHCLQSVTVGCCPIAARQPGHRMKFSNFLFPDSASPEHDGRVIDETLREARLTDELGYDTIWLAEHHFDGICAYVDPVSFAAALATATTPRPDRLRGRPDGAAPPDPPGRTDRADRPHQQRPPDRRSRPRHRL